MAISRLVVVGGARCVWEDYRTAPTKAADIMAVGNISLFCPDRVKYIASMHREVLSSMKELRQHTARIRWMRNESPETHGCGVLPKEFKGNTVPGGAVDKLWAHTELGMNPNGGSSGLFAALVGLKLGYKEIVLCGCPADSGNTYDPDWVRDEFRNKQQTWKKAADVFGGRVTSMSGFTKEFFGYPKL